MSKKKPATVTSAPCLLAIAQGGPVTLGKAKKKPATVVTPANSPMRDNSKEIKASQPKGKVKSPEVCSPLTAKYEPALFAVVSTLVTVAREAATGGLAVAARLAEAFAMNPHTVTGHASVTAWAHALLTEACPMAGQSTVYAWIEAGCARAAIMQAGLSPDLFPMDTLRVIGAKSAVGQDPQRMADLAAELAADDTLRNKAGKVDPRLARARVQGKSVDTRTQEQKVRALANKATKMGGSKEAALALLDAAIDLLEGKE